MVNALLLLEAMEGIRDEQLALAGEFLGYGAAEKAAPRRRGVRRVARYALLAALLASLLTVTAYAMGWFGLRERSFERPRPQSAQTAVQPEEKRVYLSLNGYRDSPEYLANAEWTAFYDEYMANTEIDFDSGFLDGKSADYVETCHYYGCCDQTMADKLYEIAGRYGLELHTLRLTPVTLKDFYRGAGTGAFLAPNVTGNGYIYEDGSFKMEGDFTAGEGGTEYGFTFHRHLAGAVMPYAGLAFDPEDYTEWEYTNAWGDTVLISYNEREQAGEIFFDRDGVYMNVTGGPWEGGDSPETMERLADQFLFHEALPHEADVAWLSHGPTVCAEPGDAAAWEDFLASPEGKGAAEYAAFAAGQLGEAAYWEVDPWAKPQTALLEKMTELAEKYSLTAPSRSGALVLADGEEAPAEWPGETVTLDELAELGCGRALLEQFSPIDRAYDNGVLDGSLWQLIPKGTLCVDLGPLPGEDGWESWFYRTETGPVAAIRANLAEPHGPDRGAVILYEGESAWLIGRPAWYNTAYEIEATADMIDFTLLK